MIQQQKTMWVNRRATQLGIVCSLVDVLRLKTLVLMPLHSDVRAESVQLLGRLLIIVALARQPHAHAAGNTLYALAP